MASSEGDDGGGHGDRAAAEALGGPAYGAALEQQAGTEQQDEHRGAEQQHGRHVVDLHAAASSRSAAYAGLITSEISANRSSKGRNADFIALIVNHSRSLSP